MRTLFAALLIVTPSLLPAQAPAPATLAQFQQLRWIDGRWLGSGGNYPAFYEEYRFVDDSTIQMRSFTDSTFATATDSSRIVLRDGVAASVRPGRVYDVVELEAGKIRFMRRGQRSGGHTFTRVSGREWTATLHPASPTGSATVYRMRRIGSAPPAR